MNFLTFDRDRELFLMEMKWRRKFVEEVKALFSPFGAVEEVELPEKRFNSPFIYAVVTMADNEDADRIRKDIFNGELPIEGGVRLRVAQSELRREKKAGEKKKKFTPRFCPQVWWYCGKGCSSPSSRSLTMIQYGRDDMMVFRDTDNLFLFLSLSLLNCEKPEELSDEVIDWFMLDTADENNEVSESRMEIPTHEGLNGRVRMRILQGAKLENLIAADSLKGLMLTISHDRVHLFNEYESIADFHHCIQIDKRRTKATVFVRRRVSKSSLPSSLRMFIAELI